MKICKNIVLVTIFSSALASSAFGFGSAAHCEQNTSTSCYNKPECMWVVTSQTCESRPTESNACWSFGVLGGEEMCGGFSFAGCRWDYERNVCYSTI